MESRENVCVVCECGWIIQGYVNFETETDLVLYDSSVVRKWSNGKGIGGIAKAENKDEYVLDAIGDVSIKQNKILFVIPCEW